MGALVARQFGALVFAFVPFLELRSSMSSLQQTGARFRVSKADATNRFLLTQLKNLCVLESLFSA